ncbi:MAG: heme-binding domain-containing protein [Deltaproteobacteria bacterium]|nr:heme-binding domain-containing protein [Deltaproteobacteria bacterium]
MTRGRKLLVGAAVALIAIQLIPIPRTNPPATAPLAAPPELQAVLDRACMNCHSHATKWPWYAYVAPASWLVVYDTLEGREHLNLSTWGERSAKKQAENAREMWEEVEDGEMPLPPYLLLHPEAKLSDADKAVLRAWSQSFGASSGDGGGEEHEAHHD